MCRARLTADADWLIWWVTQPTYQRSSERMPFLTTAPAARSDSTGTTGSMNVAASTIRSASPRSPPRPATGRVGQEELVELTLELGRQVARGAAQPHLLGDLRHDLLDVGPGVLPAVVASVSLMVRVLLRGSGPARQTSRRRSRSR